MLLIVFVVYQLSEAFRASKLEGTVIERVGPFFSISCILNIVWIYFWHQKDLLMAMIMIVLLLLSLIITYIKLGVGVYHPTKKVLFRVDLPFSVYLGWVSVATIANVASYLNASNWNGFDLPDTWWAVLMVIVTGVITLIVVGRRNDVFFGFTIIWALSGIYIKQAGVNLDKSLFPVVMLCVIGVLLIQIISKLIKRQVY